MYALCTNFLRLYNEQIFPLNGKNNDKKDDDDDDFKATVKNRQEVRKG